MAEAVDDLLLYSLFGTDDSSSSDTDSSSSEYDSDEINKLIEDSIAVEGSTSGGYKYEQQDDELDEVFELIGVIERISFAREVTKSSIQFLSELVNNEDNLKVLVRSGVVPALVKHLQDTQWLDEAGFDSFDMGSWPSDHEVDSHQEVLSRLLHLMPTADKFAQKRILSGLARFCAPDKHEEIFLDNNGLDVLLENLKSCIHRGEACAALSTLAKNGLSFSPVDAGPSRISQIYLGDEYVNNHVFSDVTFIIEGKRFYAHRIGLLTSSDAFRAMFDGCYMERDAKEVQIPNIRWEIFESMMRFIYTGSVEVQMGIAQDLLEAADQYLLDGLKRLCEYTMARDINADNLKLMYDLSKTYNAVSLRNACILFFLDQFDKLQSKSWYATFVLQILPDIRSYFMTTLTKPMEANSQQ